jgi:protein-S-isoprenylcysteine O-methyltransferase Ste14
LIAVGVYQSIHHPMYATIWIAAPTQPLLVHDGIAGALAICAFAAMGFIRVSSEKP